MQIPLHERVADPDPLSLRVLMWDRDLVDMWMLDERGQRRPFTGRGSSWHHHPELELTMIEQGEGVLQVGDHIGRFHGPDCLLIGGQVPHVWRTEGTMSGISIQFRLSTTQGLGVLPEVAAMDALWQRARHGIRWQGAIRSRLQDLLAALTRTASLGRLARFLDCLQAMAAAPAAEGVRLAQRATDPAAPPATGSRLDAVFDHLLEHYRDNVRLADLVALSGMPQATFCRAFLRHSGKTFIAYLHALRLQEVAHELVETERGITEIAIGAGFNNLSHFHAVFQRQMGCSPRAYPRRDARV